MRRLTFEQRLKAVEKVNTHRTGVRVPHRGHSLCKGPEAEAAGMLEEARVADEAAGGEPWERRSDMKWGQFSGARRAASGTLALTCA